MAVTVPTGHGRADAAIGDGLIGSQAGFVFSWKTQWASNEELAWEMDGIASSGARWLRLDFDWPSIQPTRNSWTWENTDRVVNAAISRGLQILAMPSYTPTWARGPGTNDKYPPTDRQTYANFVQEAVRRYKSLGVRYWEIWNEPNGFYCWMPKPNVGAYTDLLRRAYTAVKAEDPSAMVIAGGLAPAPDAADGSEVNGVTFVRQMYQAGAKGYFDALAMHPYSYPGEPMFPHPDNAFYSTTPAIYQVMVDNGDGTKKVWLTEYGAPTGGTRAVSEQDQADWLVKAYDQIVKWPWAGPLFYFMYRDTGVSATNSDEHFGLLRRDWSWKPGRSAFFNEMAKPLTTGTPKTAENRLVAGQVLNSGSSLLSNDGRYALRMQTDGNLVLYNAGG
ncbi:MAG: cellulase family glycosylhydrolase, partial [Actinomycetota bacterium]|nr:cellulase family glycosylhydrolase [Actinomycetota bacterium]